MEQKLAEFKAVTTVSSLSHSFCGCLRPPFIYIQLITHLYFPVFYQVNLKNKFGGNGTPLFLI